MSEPMPLADDEINHGPRCRGSRARALLAALGGTEGESSGRRAAVRVRSVIGLLGLGDAAEEEGE